MSTEKYSRLNNLMKKLTSYFLQGLLYAAPIGLTIYVIYLVFAFSDGILRPLIEGFLKFSIPGLGLLLMIILITLVGIMGQSFVAQPFKAAMERLMQRAPLLNMVYTSIRDFMEAFVGKEKKFTQPVRVIVNRDPEIERFGFITQSDLSELDMNGKVVVYFPFSFGFNGEIMVVSSENVKSVNMPAGEMMKFIISGGITRV
jgi:uncharacterized membrane protein